MPIDTGVDGFTAPSDLDSEIAGGIASGTVTEVAFTLPWF